MSRNDLASLLSRLKKLAEGIERGAAERVGTTALAIGQRLAITTPVDTGRARSNWFASKGAPVADIRDNIDLGGSASVADVRRIAESVEKGESIFITNSLPYIRRLNEGSSKQAPAGFIDAAVRYGVRFGRGKGVVNGGK